MAEVEFPERQNEVDLGTLTIDEASGQLSLRDANPERRVNLIELLK